MLKIYYQTLTLIIRYLQIVSNNFQKFEIMSDRYQISWDIVLHDYKLFNIVRKSLILMEDNLWWKTTFDGRWPLMEDNPLWKMIFNGRWPLMEDKLWWNTLPLIEQHQQQHLLWPDIYASSWKAETNLLILSPPKQEFDTEVLSSKLENEVEHVLGFSDLIKLWQSFINLLNFYWTCTVLLL